MVMTLNHQEKMINQLIDKMNLFDNDLMRLVLDDKECIHDVLKVILEKDIEIKEIYTQKELVNLLRRSIEIDILVIDTQGQFYNIEVQRERTGASPRRARYHASLMDVLMTKPNQKWKDISDGTVIFITEEDYYREKDKKYVIENRRI